jgi:hypothetical protein
MSSRNGTFVLLQNGQAKCYDSNYPTIVARLQELYKENPTVEYLITQVMGTVDKPAPPVIRSIYQGSTT